MKLFARQLIYKIKFGPEIKEIEEEVKQYPHVKQFLYVVDIDEDMMQVRILLSVPIIMVTKNISLIISNNLGQSLTW